MNLWGHCKRCDMWLPCPVDTDAEWGCPACGNEPLRTENRVDVANGRPHAPQKSGPASDAVAG